MDAGQSHRNDVLGRKANAGRRALEARAMSPAKALRRALSRSADALWDMALISQGVQQELLDQEGAVEVLRPDDLLVLLDGPGGEVGLGAFDRQMMMGLIEIQTIALVTDLEPDDRAYTPTDAAMTQPLIDDAMTRFADNLEDHPLRHQLVGYRYGAMVEDARTAGLLLNAAGYRSFRVAVDLGIGKRRGEMQFILPIVDHAGQRDIDADDDDTPGPHADTLRLVPARIDAVLCRVSMPLSRATALRPGDLVHLPDDAVAQAEIVSSGGKRIARGRLGQMNGYRAIRLDLPARNGARGVSAGGLSLAPGEMMAPNLPAIDAGDPAPDLDFGAEGAMMDVGGDLPDLPPLDFDGMEMDSDENGGMTDLPDLPPLDMDGELPDLPDLDGGGDFSFDPAELEAE